MCTINLTILGLYYRYIITLECYLIFRNPIFIFNHSGIS